MESFYLLLIPLPLESSVSDGRLYYLIRSYSSGKNSLFYSSTESTESTEYEHAKWKMQLETCFLVDRITEFKETASQLHCTMSLISLIHVDVKTAIQLQSTTVYSRQ